MRQKLSIAFIAAIGTMLCACSASKPTLSDAVSEIPKISSSGTIIISGSLPARSASRPNSAKSFAPLLGYAQSGIEYSPASNEYSLEISRARSTISVKIGESIMEEFRIDGALFLEAGRYLVERKENNPSWYAPDEYFSTRGLEVPFVGNSERFRRGALGNQAIFASSGLIIHSSPVWTPEVGGLRVEAGRLAALVENLGIGTHILVK